jgi:hypothetical protein
MSFLHIPDATVKFLGNRAAAQLGVRCIYSTEKVVEESNSAVFMYDIHGHDTFVLKEQTIEDRGL